MLKRIVSLWHNSLRSLIVCGTTIAVVMSATAQSNSDRSPYSRFGYGTLAQPNTAATRAMGGISYGVRDGLTLNPANPASYTSVDSLTFIFDVGASAGVSILGQGAKGDSRMLGNLDYATMIFPLSKRLAMSAGIMPIARTGYSFGNRDTMGGDSNDTQYLRSYSGSGGYNNIYVGVGGHLFAGLHIGVNASYLSGNTEHTRKITYATAGAYNPLHNSRLSLTGFKVDMGMQYELQLDTVGSRSLVFGATFTPKHSFRGEQVIRQQSTASTGTTIITQNDTIRNGNYSMPETLGFGFSYRVADRMMIGADLQYRQWNSAQFDNLQAKFQDQWKVSLGGEWIPDYRARSPWKRAKYRFGLSGGNSYLQVPTPAGVLSGYNELGASFGIGFPLVDRRSMVNVSFEYKHLAPRASSMVREHYIGATVGIVFNESWFRQARVH